MLRISWTFICLSTITIANATTFPTAHYSAHRIISLAPHNTELLFAVGAGKYVVGVSDYSDFPPAAKLITSVGSSNALDIERIVALKPDLIVAWGSGNSANQLRKLRALGIPVFDNDPHQLEQIGPSLLRLSQLTGTANQGRAAATAFQARLVQLRARYQHQAVLRVFYQIWPQPLMTINDKHIIANVIQLCGGKNVFGQLAQLVPVISIEAVLAANPEVILSAEQNTTAIWKRFPRLAAVNDNNLFELNPNWISRPGPRILDAAAEVCAKLEQARAQQHKVAPPLQGH